MPHSGNHRFQILSVRNFSHTGFHLPGNTVSTLDAGAQRRLDLHEDRRYRHVLREKHYPGIQRSKNHDCRHERSYGSTEHRRAVIKSPHENNPVDLDRRRQSTNHEPMANWMKNTSVHITRDHSREHEQDGWEPIGDKTNYHHQDCSSNQYLPGRGRHCRLFRILRIEHQRAQHRVDHKRNEERRTQCDNECERQELHELANHTRPERHGSECRQSSCCRGNNGDRDFAGAKLRRCLAIVATLPESVDVFDHHDSVVDKHTERENQTEQHNHVEREANELKDAERHEHRKWNCNSHERGCTHTKCEQQHPCYQQKTGDDVVLQTAHHVTDFF